MSNKQLLNRLQAAGVIKEGVWLLSNHTTETLAAELPRTQRLMSRLKNGRESLNRTVHAMTIITNEKEANHVESINPN